MICKSCGRANELGARFCKSCGAPLESDESMQQNNTNTKNITAAAIIAYVIGAITFIVNVVMAGNIAGLVDVMIVVGLGLGIHLAKSRACAVIITAYSIINFIYVILLAGMPGGWLIIVCGVYSIIYTFKYQNAWNKYQQTGQI